MHRIASAIVIATALGLAACSSDLNSGGMSAPGGITPPINQQGVQPGGVNSAGGAAGKPGQPGQPTPTPSAPPGNTATYAFSQASEGIRCPDVNGYSCIIHLNVPAATPSPKPGTHASASPSPTPSPSPAPSASASTSPSPSPSATPAVTIALEAQPHDAPAMVHPDTKSVATTALIALRLSTSQNVLLHGGASADFILPQGQIGGRDFAVELFREAMVGKRRIDRFIGSYANSTASGNTLHFALTPPQVTVVRGETWLFVLYASEKPIATAAPSVSPTP